MEEGVVISRYAAVLIFARWLNIDVRILLEGK